MPISRVVQQSRKWKICSAVNIMLHLLLLKLVLISRCSQLYWSCEIPTHDANYTVEVWLLFNTLGPKQNGCLFTDDTIKRIFMNKTSRISITILLKFVPYGPINSILLLAQIMDWRRPGDMPLAEPMMVRLLTHKCATWPQWINCPGCFIVGISSTTELQGNWTQITNMRDNNIIVVHLPNT